MPVDYSPWTPEIALYIPPSFSSSSTASNSFNDFYFDFSDSNYDFIPGWADLPDNANALNYRLFASHLSKPDSLGNGKSLFIAGHNRSDDLFMFYKKKLSNLPANTFVQIRGEIKFGSKYKTGSVGVGGSPGDGVVLKFGAVPFEPIAFINDDGDLKMNLDHGNQANGGIDMKAIGTIAKPDDGNDEYVLLTRSSDPQIVRTSNEGELWIIFATDSGFEGVTELYYTNLNIFISPLVTGGGGGSSSSTRNQILQRCINNIANVSNVVCEPSSISLAPSQATCRNSVLDFGIALEPVFSLATCGMNSPLGGGNLPGQILYKIIGKFTSNVNKDLECGNDTNWNENLFQTQPYWNNWKTPKDLLKELPYAHFLNTEGLPLNKKLIYDWIRSPYEIGADVSHYGGALGAIGELYKIAGCKQILNIEKIFYPGAVCQGQLNCNSSQINNSSSSSSNSSDNFCGLDLGATIDFVSTNPWAIFYPKIEIFSEGNPSPIYVHQYKFNYSEASNGNGSHLLNGFWYTSDISTLNTSNNNKHPDYEKLSITSAMAPVCFCRQPGSPNVMNTEVNNHHIRIWGNEWNDPNEPEPTQHVLRGSSCGQYKKLTAKITLQVPKIRIKIRDRINVSEINNSICRPPDGLGPKIEVKSVDLIDLGLTYNLEIPTPTPRPNDYCCSSSSSYNSSSSRQLCNGFMLDCQPGFIKVCPNPKPCPNSDEGCRCDPITIQSSDAPSQTSIDKSNSLSLNKDGRFIIK